MPRASKSPVPILPRKRRTRRVNTTRVINGRLHRKQLDPIPENGKVWCIACCAGFMPMPGVELEDMACPRGHTYWYADDFDVAD